MPVASSLVTKGKFLEYVDSRLKNPTEEMLAQYEAATRPLARWAIAFDKIPAGQTSIDHTELEFLGDDPDKAFFPPGWAIPDSAGKSGILISAYTQALRVALYENPDAAPKDRVKRPRALPIESYWVRGVRYFEFYVSLSSAGNAVHVLILTPDPQNLPDALPRGREENLWAIGTDDRIKLLHDEMRSSEPPAPFTIKDAMCQKLVGY